jgi:hypothetical protein
VTFVKKFNKRLLTSSMRQLGRHVGTNPFIRAESRAPECLHVTREHLVWRWDSARRRVTDFDGLLDLFWRIQTGADVVGFVRRYGSLWICEDHGLPVDHDAVNLALLEPNYLVGPGCSPQSRGDLVVEPLDAWLRLAERARAALTLGAEIYSDGGACRDPELWRRATFEEDIDLKLLERAEGRTALLAYIANQWLELGGVRIFVGWDAAKSGFTFELTSSTAAVLAFQIATAISRKNYVFLCDECQAFYVPNRRPQAGRRKYCPACAGKAASRNRQRALRARLHEYGNGATPVAPAVLASGGARNGVSESETEIRSRACD